MTTPNPGSPEAHKLGCNCPGIDNCYGRGFPTDGKRGFVERSNCPLHGGEAWERKYGKPDEVK